MKLIEEANGGVCDGESTEIQECEIEECPGRSATNVILYCDTNISQHTIAEYLYFIASISSTL